MSLRVKLALALVLLTTAATATIGAWSYIGTSDRLFAEIDRSLQAGAAAGQQDQAPGPTDGDHPAGATPVAPREEQVMVQTVAPNGHVVAASTGVTLPVDDLDRAIASDSVSSNPGDARRRDVNINGSPYRILTTDLENGRGAVQTARSLSETLRVLESLRNFVIVAALVIIGLAGAIGWIIATRVTRRLVRLTQAAEEVADSGRLDIAVPGGGADEAGRLGNAFAAMLAALDRSRDAQQRLVQNAGHELRTPLTSLRTNVSVLRRHPDLPSETKHRVLDDLDMETRELTTLVNELVELATDRRPDEAHAPLDLFALVERVADRARRRTGRDIVVRLDSNGARMIIGGSGALERAMSNLLDNASKFDTTGGPIDVTVLAGRVTVCDRGPGIDPADLPHIFDRFYRAVDARSQPGSGLGLAIVNDVARDHGGQVYATNREGGGVCVSLEIPTEDPTTSHLGRPAATRTSG